MSCKSRMSIVFPSGLYWVILEHSKTHSMKNSCTKNTALFIHFHINTWNCSFFNCAHSFSLVTLVLFYKYPSKSIWCASWNKIRRYREDKYKPASAIKTRTASLIWFLLKPYSESCSLWVGFYVAMAMIFFLLTTDCLSSVFSVTPCGQHGLLHRK